MKGKIKLGVYLLISNHVVVYVGQTMGLRNRLCMHRRDKVFDRYHFFECSPDTINNFESGLITRFKPIYNKKLSTYSVHSRKMALDREAREERFKQYRGQKYRTPKFK